VQLTPNLKSFSSVDCYGVQQQGKPVEAIARLRQKKGQQIVETGIHKHTPIEGERVSSS
jgi:hypothetical protein